MKYDKETKEIVESTIEIKIIAGIKYDVSAGLKNL